MNTAASLPENHLGPCEWPLWELPPSLPPCGFHSGHLLQGYSHCTGSVASQMLVGEEQHAAVVIEGPFECGPSIGRRANNPAMTATERLQLGRGIDIGDWRQIVSVNDLGEFRPAMLHLSDVGHVSQRGSGLQIGQHDRQLRKPPRSASRSGRLARMSAVLADEMDAAKNDRLALVIVGRQIRQSIAVATQIGQLNDLVALVPGTGTSKLD